MSKKVTIKSRSSAEKAPLPSVKFGEAEKKSSKLKKPSTEIEIRKSSLKATTSAVKAPESNNQINNEIVNLKPVEPTVIELPVKEKDKPREPAETLNLKKADLKFNFIHYTKKVRPLIRSRRIVLVFYVFYWGTMRPDLIRNKN